MVHALSYMAKFLTLKTEVTAADMLAVCQMYIAIAHNMSSIGLVTSCQWNTKGNQETLCMRQIHKIVYSRQRQLPNK